MKLLPVFGFCVGSNTNVILMPGKIKKRKNLFKLFFKRVHLIIFSLIWIKILVPIKYRRILWSMKYRRCLWSIKYRRSLCEKKVVFHRYGFRFSATTSQYGEVFSTKISQWLLIIIYAATIQNGIWLLVYLCHFL